MTRSLYIVPLLLLCAAWMGPARFQTRAEAPAHLKTTWGGQGTGIIDTNAARALLTAPVTVTDDKGGTYTITRFRFSYRQKSLFQDTTGKLDSTYRLFSRVYYDTPTIDTTWSASIAVQVQPTETFFIDNVVVKDARGAKSLAPSLELDVH